MLRCCHRVSGPLTYAALVFYIYLQFKGMSSDSSELISQGRKAAEALLWKESKAKGLSRPVPQSKVILATSWRSGSTFLGEALSWHPGTFYSYEPLVYFDKLKQVRVEPQGGLARIAIRSGHGRLAAGRIRLAGA